MRQKTYGDFVEVVKDIPAAMFGAVECPPEGEADLIIVADSSFALVANHDNPTLCSRLSFGELLQSKEYAISQIRTVYPGLKWGKGLSAINHQVWELRRLKERTDCKIDQLFQSWSWWAGQATMFTVILDTKVARGSTRRT